VFELTFNFNFNCNCTFYFYFYITFIFFLKYFINISYSYSEYFIVHSEYENTYSSAKDEARQVTGVTSELH